MRLDSVTPGDVAALPQIVAATRGELGRAMSDELVRQFASAAAQEVGVKRNPAAVARARESLLQGPR